MKELILKCIEQAESQQKARITVLDPEKHDETYAGSCVWMSAEKKSVQMVLDLMHEIQAARHLQVLQLFGTRSRTLLNISDRT